jgi:uncharacterized protein YqhQ
MSKAEYLQYGGQAVIEGVMMRSPNFFSVACRTPGDEIIVETEPLTKSWIGRQKWLKKPFLRGVLALLDASVLGYKAMKYASEIQINPKYEQKSEPINTAEDKLLEKPKAEPVKKSSDTINSIQVGIAMFVGMGLGLFLFTFLPNFLSEQLRPHGFSGTIINLITELIKISFFLGYMWLIGKSPEIRRVFQYHGAEHQAINTMEAHEELTIDNCLKQTRLHPRCGTSFAIVVLIVSLFCFTFVPRYPLGEGVMILNVLIRIGVELLILPFIAGFSYESIQLAGKMKNQKWVNILFWPGLMTQYLTTAEPDRKQTEVALAALKAVEEAEEKLLVKNKLQNLVDAKEAIIT